MIGLITVIIPVKDREEELKRAICSVLNQTYHNWEILIVDDKSTIDIKMIIHKFNDKRIRYFLNQKPITNANVCRNIGLTNANGEFIAMLDSDDEWLPNHLENRLNTLKKFKCDGIFGGAYIDNGKVRTLRLNMPFNSDRSMANYILNYGGAPTPTHFYTSTSAKQIMWDENLKRHQDYDFCIRYAEQFKFMSCDDPTTIIHWKKNEKRAEDFDSQIKFMTKHQSKFSSNLWKKYHVEHYSQLKDRADVPLHIKDYFKTEALRYIQFLSLADYDMIYAPKGALQKITNRLRFSFRILTQNR